MCTRITLLGSPPVRTLLKCSSQGAVEMRTLLSASQRILMGRHETEKEMIKVELKLLQLLSSMTTKMNTSLT